jgi:hypothetical protein
MTVREINLEGKKRKSSIQNNQKEQGDRQKLNENRKNPEMLTDKDGPTITAQKPMQ